jgi:hypothetical protein
VDLPGVVFWFDMLDPLTVTIESGKVSQVASKVGGYRMAQGNAAARMTYENNRELLVTQRTAPDLTYAIDPAFDIGLRGTRPITSLLVVEGQSLSNWNHVLNWASGQVEVREVAGPAEMYVMYNTVVAGTGSLLAGSDTILTFGTKGAGAGLHTVWQKTSGTSPGLSSSTISDSGWGNSGSPVLGTWAPGAAVPPRGGAALVGPARYRSWVMAFGEQLDADLRRLEGWAAWHVGAQAELPANHPYKSAAPTK